MAREGNLLDRIDSYWGIGNISEPKPVVRTAALSGRGTQKRWLTSNFRLVALPPVLLPDAPTRIDDGKDVYYQASYRGARPVTGTAPAVWATENEYKSPADAAQAFGDDNLGGWLRAYLVPVGGLVNAEDIRAIYVHRDGFVSLEAGPVVRFRVNRGAASDVALPEAAAVEAADAPAEPGLPEGSWATWYLNTTQGRFQVLDRVSNIVVAGKS